MGCKCLEEKIIGCIDLFLLKTTIIIRTVIHSNVANSHDNGVRLVRAVLSGGVGATGGVLVWGLWYFIDHTQTII